MGKGKIFEFFGIDKVVYAIQNFFEGRLESIKEEIREKVADTLSKLVPFFMLVFCFAIFLVFTSFTLALYLSQLFENLVYGFGAVTLFYLVVTITLYVVIIKNNALKEFFLSMVPKKAGGKNIKYDRKLLN